MIIILHKLKKFQFRSRIEHGLKKWKMTEETENFHEDEKSPNNQGKD